MTGLKDSDLGYKLGLISFARPSAVLRNSRWIHTVHPTRLPRVTGVLGGGMAGTPLRAWEAFRHGRNVDRIELGEDPVFILGHWRSGTTHLHNLMSHDPQFGCVRMAQALAPDCSISTRSWLPSLFERVFPQKRPMDNLVWPMDAPQEEEIPLAKMTPYSFYLQFFFPRAAIEMFRRGVLFEGASDRVQAEVRRKYLRILKVASHHDGGRRLLLKNPVNTARVPMLLDMFPNAKFIAIHRSPYEVFPSAVNLHRKLLTLTAFQKFDDALIESNVLDLYELVMDRWLTDRELIPAENLIEVSYEDLDQRPKQLLEKIYGDLDLDGWADAEAPIDAYIDSQRDYRKNGFVIGDREAALVEQRWGRFFDAFGWQRRS